MNENKPVSNAINFLFNPNGRTSRKDIWLKFLLPMLIISFVVGFVEELLIPNPGPADILPLSTALSTFYFWPQICVPVKRFHDRGMTGWWVLWFGLLMLVPIVVMFFGLFSQINIRTDLDYLEDYEFLFSLADNPMVIGGFIVTMVIWLIQIVINYLLPGDKGPNKYGDDPLNPQAVNADVFL